MLEFIRKHSKSIVVKVFLTILALTFVLFFGISDVIRRFIGKDYVVKVGSVKINPMDFKNEKAKRLGLLGGRSKNKNEKNLTTSVLHQLIWETVVDQASMEYGVIISDETIKKYVAGMNMFRDKDGRFNANLLRAFLKKIQVPETMFIESCKKDLKTVLIKSPFIYVSPAVELDEFTHSNLEKRTLAIVKLKSSSFKITEKPTQEKLKEFYNDHQESFEVAETRSLRILELQESSIEKNVQVPEEEVKDTYERSSEREDRSYDDMKTELEANLKQEKVQSEINELTRQIEDALMAGEDVAEVAKKYNLSVVAVEDVNSHNKNAESKEAIKAPYKDDVLSIAFSIDEGTDSSFSEALDAQKEKVYWLVHVDGVTPKHVAAFEKSSSKVLAGWIAGEQRKKAKETADDFVAKVKEGIGLEKLASRDGQTLTVTQPFDRFGKLQNEKNLQFKDIIGEVYEDAFVLAKSEANYKEIGGAIVVYQPKDIISPKQIDPKDEKKYETELRTEMVDDMYQQLVGYLSKKYEVKINHELLKEIDEATNQNSFDDVF